MIIGLGTDIVNIERIAKTLQKFDEHFLTRIFTAEELEAIAACGDGGNKKVLTRGFPGRKFQSVTMRWVNRCCI